MASKRKRPMTDQKRPPNNPKEQRDNQQGNDGLPPGTRNQANEHVPPQNHIPTHAGPGQAPTYDDPPTKIKDDTGVNQTPEHPSSTKPKDQQPDTGRK